MNAFHSAIPRRVLVLGGAGYIGSHAVLALDAAGYRVSVLDNLSTGFRSAVPPHLDFDEGDIGDTAFLASVLNSGRFDAIMHFAASLIVPESVSNPLKYYHNNTAKSVGVIAAAVEAGVPHIVFSSTAAVYGEPERVPVDEAVQKLPINPYGASKLMTERMLEDSAAAYPMNYAALRYFNVSGADPEGRSGQVGKGSTHLIKVAVEAAVGKRDHIDVYGTDYPTGDGSCVRDYIHVSDLVAAHVKALERLIEKPDENLVLNLGYGRGLSVLEVLDALDRLLPEPIRREMKGRRAGDPPLLISSNEALKATLDWQARYADIDTILTHALEWERKLLSRNWA